MTTKICTFAAGRFANLDLDGIDTAALYAAPVNFGYELLGSSRPNLVTYDAFRRTHQQFGWMLLFLVKVTRPSPLLAFTDTEEDLTALIQRVRPQPVLPTNPGNYRILRGDP